MESDVECAGCKVQLARSDADMSAYGPVCSQCSVKLQISGSLDGDGISEHKLEQSLLRRRYAKHVLIGTIGVGAAILLALPIVWLGVFGKNAIIAPVSIGLLGGGDLLYGLSGLSGNSPAPMKKRITKGPLA